VVRRQFAPYFPGYDSRAFAYDGQIAGEERYRKVLRQRGKNRVSRQPGEASASRKPLTKPQVKQAKLPKKPALARSIQSRPQKAVASKQRVDCEKAMATIRDYAFAVVIAKKCQSDEYVFEATRDDKRYEVKVNSQTGDLITVRKLKSPDEQAASLQ